ncbi:hypothetical protein AZE42_08198 [Rhizopogon vesiculosus]|uniref:RecF/RecN/SMC N-terminal domain-containing protein n=1 Tax=Rhizopogon vesiculosus TaxID=180088 RepID=A0A1J8QLF6_9AGAM|nr:hypothetical protein AZE42_08198 [Rhizopogon vesiculosus]
MFCIDFALIQYRVECPAACKCCTPSRPATPFASSVLGLPQPAPPLPISSSWRGTFSCISASTTAQLRITPICFTSDSTEHCSGITPACIISIRIHCQQGALYGRFSRSFCIRTRLNHNCESTNAAGTSTNPNNIVNVPSLDNVPTTSVFGTKKGRASGAKTGMDSFDNEDGANQRFKQPVRIPLAVTNQDKWYDRGVQSLLQLTHANPAHGAAPDLDYSPICPLMCTFQVYDTDAANLASSTLATDTWNKTVCDCKIHYCFELPLFPHLYATNAMISYLSTFEHILMDIAHKAFTQRAISRVQSSSQFTNIWNLGYHQTMPPRRSSRSVRASVEQESNSAKRKRTDADHVEEKENALGARRRSTRGSVGPSSKIPAGPPSRATARTSSRPNRALEEVAETEEEEPERKKSRKSVEGEDDDEDEDEDDDEIVELPKPRGGRAKKVVQDDDEVQEVKPPRRSSAKPRPTRSRKTVKVLEASDDEESKEFITISEDDEEEVKPTRRRSAKPQPSRSRKTVRVELSDDEESKEPIPISGDDEEETQEVKPKHGAFDAEVTPRPRKSSPVTPRKHTPPATEDGTDDLDGFQEEFHQTPRRVPRHSQQSQATPKRLAPPEEEEEEMSLLEPRVKPMSVVQPPPPEESSGPKPRLVIHKMVLIDFKSYAGRQEIGPFHKSFSSIVGPNGSGKSNTIDALLFVFGYRASKMRQGKLSELIHNSARYPDLDECSVEVHFREIIDLPGPDAYRVVPNSSLIVARTATKSNTSRYTVNSRSSTYTEVQALLQGRGIDLTHKRFLILQGEVESIAQMKPKGTSEHDDGLLEYLEDIIGTAALKAPIETALGEVDRLGEERAEKVARLRIVEKEKAKLDAERKEALAWLKLANEHVRALSRLWQYYLWKCLENDEQFAAQIEHLEKELAEERERNKDDITHLEMLEKHYKERKKAYEEVKAAAEEAATDQSAREKQSVGLEERRKHASAKAKKLKKALSDDEQSKRQAENVIQDSDAKIKTKKREIAEHEANLEKEEKVLEGIRDSLKDKTQVFHEQIEAKQKELQPWTGKINIKQAAIDVATSERDALAKKATGLKDAVTQAEGQLTELQVEQEGKSNELDHMKAKKADVRKNMEACEEKFHVCPQAPSECDRLMICSSFRSGCPG